MLENIYITIPFVVFVINIFLAALVIKGEWRSYNHRIFAGFLTAMSLWGLLIFGMRSSPDLEAAFEWERWVFVVIGLASALFYHFTLVFTNSRGRQGTLWVLYGLLAVVSALSVGGFVATEMQQKFYGYAPVLGPAFPLYLAVAYTPIALAFRVLIRALRRSASHNERRRIAYVIVGASMSVFGATTDFLAPLGLRVYPMGVVMNIGFGVVTTIAVTRYQLFSLRVLLRRGFYYSLLSTAIFAVYGAILLLFLVVFRNQTALASVLATLAALMVVTLALPPVITRAQRFVDRLFFRERYDHLMAMQEFTATTRDIADFSGLADSLVHTVQQALQADWATVLIPDPENQSFVAAGSLAPEITDSLTIPKESWVASWFRRHHEVLTPNLIEYDPYLQAMADSERKILLGSGVQLLVPLRSKDELTGILALGPRVVDEDYSAEDIGILEAVASQTATMIENSRMYSQEMERLRELERLNNLKSNLLRTVSHELKSPITAVKTAVDLLSIPDEQIDERSRARLMRTLQNGIDRLQRLVAESLEYAQMRGSHMELRREPTNLGKLVEAAVGLVGPSFTAKRQVLEVSVEPDLPDLLIDPEQVERVLLNLLTNANKFTPVEGSIWVRVRTSSREVIAEVADTGRGIPAADQENIFGEYYRGSNADGAEGAGTGLGLAIAKSLTELHGGKISFESEEGVGTTFRVELPMLTELEPDADSLDEAS